MEQQSPINIYIIGDCCLALPKSFNYSYVRIIIPYLYYCAVQARGHCPTIATISSIIPIYEYTSIYPYVYIHYNNFVPRENLSYVS